jgi:hypothetical protein
MNHSNTIAFPQIRSFSLKPLYAIRDFFILISAAWEEAKALEQKSHKNSANW